MLCSIFLLDADGVHLRYAAAPTLPESYRAATDGLAYGPNVGSCGTAVYRREAVFVPDILSDPLWVNFRQFAAPAGLRAAWSSPIISNDGRVLGTFGMYYREVHNPTSDDIRLIEHASPIAAIAIEREQSQTALKGAFERIEKSEAALREIVDAIRHDVVVLAADGSVIYVNRSVLELTGLSEREVMEVDFRSKAFHPEDLKRLREARKAGFSGNILWENEVRVRRKDGQYRWFLIRYSPLFDEKGQVRQWCAAGLDIEDRKRDEERLRRENLALREDLDLSSMYEEIVGSSRPLRSVLSQVGKVAPTDSTVLIYGETGTGKELVARVIHKRSNRSASAFIKVNCAAIPPSLIASELFGHEKGAFTGAIERRIGRFEAADGGTIFLDEVGELLPETQLSLLRVLQERELERVGSNPPIRINVRVLAATNRDLEASVEQGAFRSDLFYRLNVFPLRVPSLRERRDDIPMLVEYLVERYTKRSGKRIRSTAKENRALYEHAIATLIGKPASLFSMPVKMLTTPVPAIPVGVPSQLLQRRPDIAAAERTMAQANAIIGIEKAAYYPTLSLTGSGGVQSSNIAKLFSIPALVWSLGASASETIFDAGLRKATMAQYTATYNADDAAYKQTVLTAFQQVEDYIATLRVLSEQIVRQDAAVEAAQRYVQIALARYQTGLDPYLDVMAAQLILLSDQQTEVTLRVSEMTAAVQLIQALGGGWDGAQLPAASQVTSRGVASGR
jgi:PAS domain S-box-containing protein